MQITLQSSGALLDGSNWKLYPLQCGLIFHLSFGISLFVVEMVKCLLPHKLQSSLKRFYVDLVQGLWLIGYLFQLLSYPGNSSSVTEHHSVHACIILYTC